MGLSRGHPKAPAMSFYDRPTDSQPHAHPVGFCRKERVEDVVDVVRLDPNSRVFHRDMRIIGFMYVSGYSHNPRMVRDSTHCVNSIHDQVNDYLPQLNSIGQNLWESAE